MSRRSRPSLRYLGISLVLSVLGALVATSACSSPATTSGASCNQDPFTCAAGTTCTVSTCTCKTAQCTSSNCTPTFGCLPSDPNGLAGAECTTELGKATCGDGLACVVFSGAAGGSGTCTPYCSATQPCQGGLVCTEITVMLGSSPTIQICEPPVGDGGFFLESGQPFDGPGGGGGDGTTVGDRVLPH